jgi:hypothetical protein
MSNRDIRITIKRRQDLTRKLIALTKDPPETISTSTRQVSDSFDLMEEKNRAMYMPEDSALVN